MITNWPFPDLVDTEDFQLIKNRRCVMGQREEHRYFDKDFKYEAIRLMNGGNRSVKDIAGDLDIHPNLLHQWRRKYQADMEHSFPGKGHMAAPEEELRRLRRENENLKEEKAILKKALAIFSKHRE
jgi:transposase